MAQGTTLSLLSQFCLAARARAVQCLSAGKSVLASKVSSYAFEPQYFWWFLVTTSVRAASKIEAGIPLEADFLAEKSDLFEGNPVQCNQQKRG